MKGIRGAIAPVNNSAEDISMAAQKLFFEVLKSNKLDSQKISAVFFTATKDLDASYPAKGLRDAGMDRLPMVCAQEMFVQGSLENCLRILVLTSQDLPVVSHIYLGSARKLRPDWVGDSIG